MFKRLALIGVLFVGMTGLLGASADAFPPSLAGWSFTLGSINATTIWTGVANSTLTPSYVAVTLDNISLRLYSINPGGNTGGIGEPFDLTSSITNTDVFDNVTKNGKYLSEIIFYDSEFASLVDPAALPNPNWTFDPNHVDVTHFKGIIQGFTDVDDRCEAYYVGALEPVSTSCFPFDSTAVAEEVVHVEVDCSLQDGAYACTLLQDWEWSKKEPVYTP